MLYLPKTNPCDAERARVRLEWLIRNGRPFELSERRKRTLNANAYLHVILAYFAAQVGETADYVKRFYFKLHCNRDTFERVKTDRITGRQVAYLRSTAELTAGELSLCITRFRDWAAAEGWYIPSPDEHIAMLAMEREVEKYKEFV